MRLRRCETEAVAPFSVGLGVPSEPGSLLSTVEYMCNDVGWCSEDGVCGEDLHGGRVVVASRRSMSNVCARSVMCRVRCLPHSDWLFGSALGCWDPIRVGRRTPRTPPLTSPLSIRSTNRVVDKDGDHRGTTVRGNGSRTWTRDKRTTNLACSWAFHRLHRIIAAAKFARKVVLAGVLVHRATRPLRGSVSRGSGWSVPSVHSDRGPRAWGSGVFARCVEQQQHLVCRFN